MINVISQKVLRRKPIERLRIFRKVSPTFERDQNHVYFNEMSLLRTLYQGRAIVYAIFLQPIWLSDGDRNRMGVDAVGQRDSQTNIRAPAKMQMLK